MEECWQHGLVNGTDYAGGNPGSIARDIVFHERSANARIIGVRASGDDESKWRAFLPSIFVLEIDDTIPAGCGYLLDEGRAPVAFLIGVSLDGRWEE